MQPQDSLPRHLGKTCIFSLSLSQKEMQYIPSSSPLNLSRNHRYPKTSSSWPRSYPQKQTSFCSKSRIYYAYFVQRKVSSSHCSKVSATRRNCIVVQLKEVPTKKKGTIAGAVALIIGTSIGSGILALPKKTSPAGLLPSSISLTICWAFLLIEALLLVEINVKLLNKNKKKKRRVSDDELEVISIRTMAQETLGEWGGGLATVTYVFLGYTSMIAYSSQAGEILFHLLNLPESISGVLFTGVFAILISAGGTRVTDQVNQVLTVSMIGLLVAIETLAIVFGGWSGFEGGGDWGKVPATIPVMIFSLVYHDLAPVLCAYLEGDIRRIRASVLLGSIVPLVGILVWDAIALGLSSQADQLADPIDLLMSVQWSGVPTMVEGFSLLAVGTSIIGTLLGFSQFYKEQLNNLTWFSPPTRILSSLQPKELNGVLWKWWGDNKVGFIATAMVIAPTLFVSTAVPDAFSAATDIAGGYCMTMLYGVLPPAMAWSMYNRESDDGETKVLSGAKPALLGVGLFACGIVVEQILLDLSFLPS